MRRRSRHKLCRRLATSALLGSALIGAGGSPAQAAASFAEYPSTLRPIPNPAGVSRFVSAVPAPLPGPSPSTSARVAEGNGAVFPARSLVLSVKGVSALSPSQVHVSEDGRPVSGAALASIAHAGTADFAVVLAIDVSPSMKGKPLAEAMAAARALAAQRKGNQQLAVVTFDQHATLTLPLTDNPQAIERALARAPAIGSGAYIYNALTTSIQQLADSKIAAGAVILLSDGASQGAKPVPGHRVTASSIGAAASAAHVRIYTVGLRDSSYTPQRMSLLARVGGGAFIESTSSELTQVLMRIEQELTSEYVIHYHSSAPLGKTVQVAVAVDGVSNPATLTYASPPPPRPLKVRRLHESFWDSTLALLVFSVGAAVLLAFGAVAYLRPRTRRDVLRRRVGEFTAAPAVVAPEPDRSPARERLAAFERVLDQSSRWTNFKADVEIAGFERSALELAGICALTTLAAAVFFGGAVRAPVLAVAALLAGPFVLRVIVHRRLRRRRDEFAAQLPNQLQELASTMRAGHSLVSGITAMAEAASEPSRSEWRRVVADEQLGVPLEAALVPLRERMDCRDVDQVALVASLQMRSGGNMAEVLERLADGVRERADLRRELDGLTAQARLSRWVVTCLPIGLLLVLTGVDPHYVDPLYHTKGGQIMLAVALVFIVSGSLVMRRITDIKT